MEFTFCVFSCFLFSLFLGEETLRQLMVDFLCDFFDQIAAEA